MKITKEQIKDGLNKAYKEAGNNAYFGSGFDAGIKFAMSLVNETQENVINCPDDLVPVIAKIEHGNSLGHSSWYEVVYYSESNWKSYSSSKTFSDGENVSKWKYCKDCL